MLLPWGGIFLFLRLFLLLAKHLVSTLLTLFNAREILIVHLGLHEPKSCSYQKSSIIDFFVKVLVCWVFGAN